MTARPTAVKIIAKDGSVSYAVLGDAEFYIIDERSSSDRVYKISTRISPDGLEKLLGDSPIGSSSDSRHAAVVRRIQRYLDGKPLLDLVTLKEDS